LRFCYADFMTILSTISKEEFNTQQDYWEKQLLSELKITDHSQLSIKKSLDAGSWNALSLKTNNSGALSPEMSWKKSSQTYALSDLKGLQMMIEEDHEGGVRNFFLNKDHMSDEALSMAIKVLGSLINKEEVDVFLLGSRSLTEFAEKIHIVDESQMCTGRIVHDAGGSLIQELAVLALNVIKKAQNCDVLYLGVFLDSQFFRNIAKLRAARLITLKILEELGLNKKVRLIGLTSMRDWTLYERFSNLLRNDVSVASGLIGGADYIQSTGYQILFELESVGSSDKIQNERSRRMARNTSHILSLESMLGVVEDASFGSFHLENLSDHLAHEAWSQMQGWLKADESQIRKESHIIASQRLERIKTRKHVIAGINDFPDSEEKLNLKNSPQEKFFRVARDLEKLRLDVEAMSHRPKVSIMVFGDQALLRPRVSFAKNYFELLGLAVEENNEQADILIVCAADETYPTLKLNHLSAREKFIAGKVNVDGFKNIFAGQNIFEVLEGVVLRWSRS